jgi:hypothetical protein
MTSVQFGRGSTQPTEPHRVHLKCAQISYQSQSGSLSSGTSALVPAAGAGISIGRANAIDQDSSEAFRPHVGGATSCPVAKSGVGFAAPRHATLERHKGKAANFQLVVDWNAAKLQRVVGVENRYRECAVRALCGASGFDAVSAAATSADRVRAFKSDNLRSTAFVDRLRAAAIVLSKPFSFFSAFPSSTCFALGSGLD